MYFKGQKIRRRNKKTIIFKYCCCSNHTNRVGATIKPGHQKEIPKEIKAIGRYFKTWTLKMIANAQERSEANHCVESYRKMVNPGMSNKL